MSPLESGDPSLMVEKLPLPMDSNSSITAGKTGEKEGEKKRRKGERQRGKGKKLANFG